MKTIFRRIFAAVLSLGVLALGADLRVSAAGANCDVDHSDDHKWNSNYSLSSGEYFFDEAVKLSDEIKISGDVTICLNGKTITAAEEHRVFNIQNGGSLTLCNCYGDGTIAGGDVKKYGGDGGSSGGAVYVASGGKFILMNGNITSSSAVKGGGVYVDSSGEFTMHGGIISKNKSIIDTTAIKPEEKGGDGGGVYVHHGGTFTMSGGTIFNNEAEDQGGGVHVCGNDGKFIMSGGVIKENKSAEGGGVYTGGTFTMSGGTISDNTADPTANPTDTTDPDKKRTFGGGVCVSGASAKFTMNGGIISGNEARNGGGVYVSSTGTVEINDGTIGGGNKASNNGGGVFIAGGTGTIAMSGGKISDNKSKNGGGIYVNGGAFTMTGGEVSNNTADNKGCCVFMSNDKGGGTMTLNGTVTLTSNPKLDGSKSNVYLADTKTITIGAAFAPTAIIGVHPETPPEDCVHYVPVTTFAPGATIPNIMENFSADIKGQYVVYDEAEGEVKLVGEHAFNTGTWDVTSETHSNTCTRDGCNFGLITELHNFDSGVITKQPTYTENGEKTYTCLTCGWEETEPIPLKVSYDDDDDDDYYYDNDDPNSQTAAPYNPQMGIAVSIAPTILAALGVAVVIYRKQNK